MTKDQERVLVHSGWTVVEENPIKIRHLDGSIATGQAIAAVYLALREKNEVFTIQREKPLNPIPYPATDPLEMVSTFSAQLCKLDVDLRLCKPRRLVMDDNTEPTNDNDNDSKE